LPPALRSNGAIILIALQRIRTDLQEYYYTYMQKTITANTFIQTIVEVSSDFSDRMIPKGTFGTIIECYESPEGYAVDLAIPDENWVGEWAYENVILTPTQFIISGTLAIPYDSECQPLTSATASNEATATWGVALPVSQNR
jgi:hypothetical protein